MSKNGVACCVIALLVGAAAGGAQAGDMSPRSGSAGSGGTVGMAPVEAAWAEPLPETEMADLRGGFNGVAFSFNLSGLVTDTGSAIELGGAGTFGNTNFEFSPDWGENGGSVQLQTFVGESLNGFHGIFQSANVIGDGVVIDQTLVMNVNVFLNSATSPTSFSLFGG